MPYIVGELYGHRLYSADYNSASKSDGAAGQPNELPRVHQSINTTPTGQLTARCEFRNQICDGGGNRDMMRIPARDETIGLLFSNKVGKLSGGFLPCGVCTVLHQKQDKLWAICPHRLFAIGKNGIADPHQWLAQKIFRLFGFEKGDTIEVWSEIHLRDKAESGAKFDYRLDYVLRRKGNNQSPVVIEVMTCSTSGGNRERHTDMKSAFKNATLATRGLQFGPVQSPGVNLRQVWARMASQLIAKSEAAIAWGGRTVWIIQDHLARYIQTQTALPLDQLRSPNWEPDEVNLVVSNLNGSADLYSGPIRPKQSTRRCWLEILGAPHIPTSTSLVKKLERLSPIARIEL